MIDVMDKHFQDYLHLSKAQSAWVQISHNLGYLLMSLVICEEALWVIFSIEINSIICEIYLPMKLLFLLWK